MAEAWVSAARDRRSESVRSRKSFAAYSNGEAAPLAKRPISAPLCAKNLPVLSSGTAKAAFSSANAAALHAKQQARTASVTRPSSRVWSASKVTGTTNKPVIDAEVENPELGMMKKLMIAGAMSGQTSNILPPGHQSASHYHFGKVIGVGSFGKVRLAWHKGTGSRVAVKTYKRQNCKDPNDWKRIQTEARLMKKISHVHCIRLFESIETPKCMHMVMDCCSGGSLVAYLKQHKRLPEKEACFFFNQIVRAVEYLHSCNIVHRDIKLENVLLGSNRTGCTAKLVDFGFSVVSNNPNKRLKVLTGLLIDR
jgi:hypothetical protein